MIETKATLEEIVKLVWEKRDTKNGPSFQRIPFGHLVRKIREHRGTTEETLADALPDERLSVPYLERFCKDPSEAILDAVVSVLQVDDDAAAYLHEVYQVYANNQQLPLALVTAYYQEEHSIPKLLSRIRSKRGLHLNEVSKKLGVSDKRMPWIEKSNYRPWLDQLTVTYGLSPYARIFVKSVAEQTPVNTVALTLYRTKSLYRRSMQRGSFIDAVIADGSMSERYIVEKLGIHKSTFSGYRNGIRSMPSAVWERFLSIDLIDKEAREFLRKSFDSSRPYTLAEVKQMYHEHAKEGKPPFRKILRQLRKARFLNLGEMAERLQMQNSGYNSIELGIRACSQRFFHNVLTTLPFEEDARAYIEQKYAPVPQKQEKFWSVVSHLREYYGISVRSFVRSINLSLKNVYNYAREDKLPNPKTFERIAVVLNLDEQTQQYLKARYGIEEEQEIISREMVESVVGGEKEIGSIFKSLREMRHLPQKALGHHLGISNAGVAVMEARNSTKYATQIMKFLGLEQDAQQYLKARYGVVEEQELINREMVESVVGKEKKIGSMFKSLREMRHLSQEALGRHLGICTEGVAAMEARSSTKYATQTMEILGLDQYAQQYVREVYQLNNAS
ncbi:helix-turn-helix domain-containing protein [Candidatus Woesearchaeota archaeon]|nr:helix-turn-helix domain-containing protein [Candidatus Woesearchaeota archaeon]